MISSIGTFERIYAFLKLAITGEGKITLHFAGTGLRELFPVSDRKSSIKTAVEFRME
jgi:hypothetical protein